LLAELTAEQLEEWKAYDKLDPLGELRQDFRFATLWARILNLAVAVMTPKGQKAATVSPADFMPRWGETFDEYTPTEDVENQGQTIEVMKLLFADIAGKTKRSDKPK